MYAIVDEGTLDVETKETSGSTVQLRRRSTVARCRERQPTAGHRRWRCRQRIELPPGMALRPGATMAPSTRRPPAASALLRLRRSTWTARRLPAAHHRPHTRHPRRRPSLRRRTEPPTSRRRRPVYAAGTGACLRRRRPHRRPPRDASSRAAGRAPMEQVERDTAYARSALEEDSEFESALLTDLLVEVQDSGASDLHLTLGRAPDAADPRLAGADGGPAAPDAAGDPADALRDPHPEAAGELRRGARARLRLLACRAAPASA